MSDSVFIMRTSIATTARASERFTPWPSIVDGHGAAAPASPYIREDHDRHDNSTTRWCCLLFPPCEPISLQTAQDLSLICIARSIVFLQREPRSKSLTSIRTPAPVPSGSGGSGGAIQPSDRGVWIAPPHALTGEQTT
jgi:hypothetical protein